MLNLYNMEEIIKEIFKLAEIVPSNNQIEDVKNILNMEADYVVKTNLLSNYLDAFTPNNYVKLYKLLKNT